MGTGRFEFPAESGVRTPGRRRQTRRCGASEKHADGHAMTRCCARESESVGTAANDYFRSRSLGVSASPRGLYSTSTRELARLQSALLLTGKQKKTLVCIPPVVSIFFDSKYISHSCITSPSSRGTLSLKPPRVARKRRYQLRTGSVPSPSRGNPAPRSAGCSRGSVKRSVLTFRIGSDFAAKEERYQTFFCRFQKDNVITIIARLQQHRQSAFEPPATVLHGRRRRRNRRRSGQQIDS